MDFSEIVKKRYATKKFTGEMIPQDKIDELLDLVRLAPSSFGLQQFKVKVVTDKEMKEKLQAASWNQPQITTCSHLLVFCAYTDVPKRIKQFGELMTAAGVPAENVQGFTDMTSGFVSNLSKEALLAWTSRQAYIALDHAMLGATALGFDSCPMEGFDAAAYSKILELPENTVPVVICPVGIAADEPRPKLRVSKDDLFF
ncbi:MAG: NAD(P)H-dependent oxidoreductase [Nanoarchaeota archaeon]|nr:NAD(P)H-dependent oxidoreductase [Nanoarchaeota archaeon]